MGLIGNNINNNFENDIKAINNIKSLGLDMINKASSGHPGIVLGAAPILYTLYAKHMMVDVVNDKWINRDRFVMSSGHGSALLYATLLMSGFNLKIKDLEAFRQLGSITPGHPEYGVTPGVDVSTGPLGEGIAMGVGMAIAEKFLNNRFKYDKDKSLINHYTYVLCGDGDLMEGVSYEATSIAGNLGLNKLIVLYDCNEITLDTDTKNTFKEDILKRFEACNWHTIEISGGNLKEIDDAIIEAKQSNNKPTLIKINTKIGKDSILEGTSLVHGKPLTEEDLSLVKKKLQIRDLPFTITKDAYEYMTGNVKERNEQAVINWKREYDVAINKFDDIKKLELDKLVDNDLSIDVGGLSLKIERDSDESLRDLSSKILNDFITEDILMLGGSADVSTSTKTYLNNMGDFLVDNPGGRNIRFGVREHAMGSICNGICLSGIKVFSSTFLVFSDYLKPAIRLSAIMNLPVIYIFTHDTLTVGEDGVTHQACEQLVALRSIPNVEVFRPCDLNELLGSYKIALSKKNGPTVIVLSKENSKILDVTKMNEVAKGGYIIKDVDQPDGILISCGNEMHTVLDVANDLENRGIKLRVVSMPSIERFKINKKTYQDEILLPTVKKIVVEYSSSYSWSEFVYNRNYLICLDKFGKSGKKEDLLHEYMLDKESILKRLEELLK